MFIVNVTCTCPYDDSNRFPWEIGGTNGDTFILCFDYQEGIVGGIQKGRLAIGGQSFSSDVVTHPVGSGFLYLEDSISYKLIWAKEFYASMGQAISIVECIIDNANDFVFAATS